METLATIAKVLIIVLAISNVAIPFFTERRNYGFVLTIWKRFSVRMFFETIGVIVLVLIAGGILWQIPGLKYGWFNLIYHESGNIFARPITDGSHSTSVLVRAMVPLFFLAFALVMPFLVKIEEEFFRKGHSEWKPIVRQSVKFGLMHCLVGIPLAFGIALTISGLFFGLKYKRAFDKNIKTMKRWEAEDKAALASTTYHTMYNTIVVAVIIFLTVTMV